MKTLTLVLLVSFNAFGAELQRDRPTQFLINGHFIEIDGDDPRAFGHFSNEDIDVLSGYMKEVLAEKASAEDMRRYNRAIHVQLLRGLEFDRSVVNHRGYTQAPALTEYQLYISAIASSDQVKAFLREQFENLPAPEPFTRAEVREGWCRRLLSKALRRMSTGD